LNNQASVFSPVKEPDFNHIICLYVDGILSVPTPPTISINGVPSVEAIAIPP
jgi:hypothetical protein